MTEDILPNYYLRNLFNLSLLYALIIFLFGLISPIVKQQSSYHEKIKKLYLNNGTTKSPAQLNSSSDYQSSIEDTNNNQQSRVKYAGRFCFHFFSRSSVLTCLFFAAMIIYHYKEPIVSLVLSCGLSGYIIASWGKITKKFISAMCFGVGFVYSLAQFVGWLNGWHNSIVFTP